MVAPTVLSTSGLESYPRACSAVDAVARRSLGDSTLPGDRRVFRLSRHAEVHSRCSALKRTLCYDLH